MRLVRIEHMMSSSGKDMGDIWINPDCVISVANNERDNGTRIMLSNKTGIITAMQMWEVASRLATREEPREDKQTKEGAV